MPIDWPITNGKGGGVASVICAVGTPVVVAVAIDTTFGHSFSVVKASPVICIEVRNGPSGIKLFPGAPGVLSLILKSANFSTNVAFSSVVLVPPSTILRAVGLSVAISAGLIV